MGEHEHFVIKPARGRAGSGIAVLGPKTAEGWEGPRGEIWDEKDIRRRLGDILFGDFARRISDRALIEERIFPGPIFGDIPVIGLPDIRVITLDCDPVMASEPGGSLRAPTL